MANTAASVLAVAAGEVGYSRWDDPQPGTKYGRWYAGLVNSPYYGESGVPYCAMFVSWVLAQAGAACQGFPGAYCPTMLAMAQRAGKVLANKRDAKPGDPLFFDWDGDGVVDHVGIVESNNGTSVTTIEGNTSTGVSGSQSNGGVVARRTRSWGTIYAVVRPDYDGVAAGTGTKLDVDGWVGPETVKRWQEQLGTVNDGVISGQDTSARQYIPAVTAVEYGRGGSILVQQVQREVGATVDGYLGPETVTKLQRWLNTKGYELEADGYLGAHTAEALQRSLNDARWI